MKRYSEYKDTHRAWLGEIPKHWNIKCLKHASRFINGYAFSSDSYTDNGIPLVRIGDIKPKIDLSETKNVPTEYYETLSNFRIKHADILLALTGATIGKSSVYELTEPALLNQRVAIVRPEEIVENDFLKHVIDSALFRRHIDYECDGGAQENIGKPEVGNFVIALPPLTEQKQIADFLDRKTQQIDTLIEKKQKLIDLLKEQRTAIINQAVTKGLDLNVPMKDSGIEWLGEIPQHWELKKLKYLAIINPAKGMSLFSNDSEELTTFLPMEKVNGDGTFDPRIKKPIRELWNGFTYFENKDSIIAKITPCFENGKGAYLENIGSEIGFGSTEFHVLRPLANQSYPKFLFYLTRENLFRMTGEAFMVGSAGQKRVPTSFIENFIAVCPPLPEQKQIVEHLDKKRQGIDESIKRENQSIELLKEYRTALISEAVTGKIDVRGEKV